MRTQADPTATPAVPATAFPTTQWSLVLQAGTDESASVRLSLETLCRRYWYPLYGFLRRQGHPHHAAEDLTQGFFAHLLASDALSRATPERGRFRTFLLTALRNFTTSSWRRAHAAKRGGGTEAPLPALDTANAEASFAAEPVDLGLTPEEAYDRNWALGLIQRAVDELRAEYSTTTSRATLFVELLPHVLGDTAGEPQSAAACRLGLNEQAFAVAVSRLRRRLRERLRAHVADTLAHPEETDDELRILLGALRGRTNPR